MTRIDTPVETLAFFGFRPTMTVLDIGPGTGYYAELTYTARFR
jgi:predicted methyltransferase